MSFSLHKITNCLFGFTLITTSANLAFNQPAQAQLKVCNESTSTAYVAVGYGLGDDKWKSEGWWRVPKGECETVVKQALDIEDFYYIYAADEDENFVWKGSNQDHKFCVNTQEDFSLVFSGDKCSGDNTDKRNFLEIKVDNPTYTYKLTD
ncbi:hypothetical protein B6N60_00069 [Richelia sinica FACHB-800]|uniref:DUF1036 domain-containing protein n=1 Tax=Richelia sinica FACHB-800 TaxID=1357546 RepID=A0A975T3R4_9NOST|nr:DUF1036 domain-containing protein [Richelia sinica]MBD2665326.1 DUF1036 domain-containing protein [Richelia sinica FACHB-800]QXE21395.1 hypothetical protein B6N60_00069 [Richelia sinica FACHB-800]